jgi:hypothetical protein
MEKGELYESFLFFEFSKFIFIILVDINFKNQTFIPFAFKIC